MFAQDQINGYEDQFVLQAKFLRAKSRVYEKVNLL